MLKNTLILSFLLPLFALAQTPQEKPLPRVNLPVFKKDTFRITQYGAIADGQVLNTKSINNAIDAATKKAGA